MRRMFVYAALLTLAASAPAGAERVYVPMIGAPDGNGRAMPTEIWVANGQEAKTAASAGFVRGAGAKSRSFEVAPGGRLLDGLAGRGEIGLVEVDAEEMAVSAWIPAGDGNGVSEVPVIGAQDSYHAGAEPGLEVAREYDRLLVGAANVSDRAASCQAMLFDESNAEIARIPFEVPAKSLARHDAAGWLGAQKAAYAQVGCDREFYPVAATTHDRRRRRHQRHRRQGHRPQRRLPEDSSPSPATGATAVGRHGPGPLPPGNGGQPQGHRLHQDAGRR